MELDNSMVINGGANGPDWNAPDDEPYTPEEKAEDQARLDRKARAEWGEELRAAMPGDVIVRVDSDGFRIVLIVRERHGTHLSGDGFLATKGGQVFGVTIGNAVAAFDVPVDTADVQIVSL